MHDEEKQQAAIKGLDFIEDGMTVGVGTGSTVNFFIKALANIKHRINATVASSVQTEQLLKQYGIPVLELNVCNTVDIYIDGADEINHFHQMIKGGGSALTREKILAAASKQFICIADSSKWVEALGTFPLPIEVIPMARSFVGRTLVKMGGSPSYRENVLTDNGNIILDVDGLDLSKPEHLETQLNDIPGVVCCGLFSHITADKVILGGKIMT